MLVTRGMHAFIILAPGTCLHDDLAVSHVALVDIQTMVPLRGRGSLLPTSSSCMPCLPVTVAVALTWVHLGPFGGSPSSPSPCPPDTSLTTYSSPGLLYSLPAHTSALTHDHGWVCMPGTRQCQFALMHDGRGLTTILDPHSESVTKAQHYYNLWGK